jgi:hypothetical protein
MSGRFSSEPTLRQPPDLVMFGLDGVAWQLDVQTDRWTSIASDIEVSEGEEGEVERALEASEELNAARELIRVGVR